MTRALWTGLILLLAAQMAACQIENPLLLPTDTPAPATATAEPGPTETPMPNTIAAFEDLLEQAQPLNANRRQELANRYTAQLAAAPIVEGERALFLWRGEAQSVGLVGDMNNWKDETAAPLARLEGTDLWYLAADYEPEARLDYRLLIDGRDRRLDPLNPRTVISGFGPNSELVMPGYVTPEELRPVQEAVSAGRLQQHTLASSALNQTRTFFVYTPAGQLVGQKLPSVYIQDGGDYLNLIDAPTILDRLIAARQIPPLVAIFIPPIIRDADYGLKDDYVTFLADELVPFVQESYDTDPDPAKTAVLGASMGGLASIHAAVSRPEVFGLAAGQSGAYTFGDDALIRLVDRQRSGLASRRPARFYLVAGTYETAVGGSDMSGDYLSANRRLAQGLERIGQEVLLEERPEGHSWGLWRGTLGRGLEYLFSP